jgi:cysteine desulfurase/selenocysteine lyase
MTAPAIKTSRYDLEKIRSDFPILSRSVHGRPLVYLDNAASAQKPKQVMDAISAFVNSEYSNVHRGVHFLAAAATRRYEEARSRVQIFLNAAHGDEIVWTRGGTEAINLVASSYLAPRIEPGDEIILSVMEHHSNIVPWHFLRERCGAVLKWVDVSDDGDLDPQDVAHAIGPKTKLVAVTHMSNVLGTHTALAEITAIAHAQGVPVLADGCQAAVHGKVDVRALDVDFYVLTGHKLYGPTGIGVLYAKRAYLRTMRPYQGGGEMIREVKRESTTYADPPMRFEAGTPPIIGAVGFSAALDYLDSVGQAAAAAHENALARKAEIRLMALNGVRLIGEAKNKGPIVSFETVGIHAHDLATILDQEGVAVRAGHHCAQVLMDRFDVPATARASFGLYNSEAEVDALVDAVQTARRVFA